MSFSCRYLADPQLAVPDVYTHRMILFCFPFSFVVVAVAAAGVVVSYSVKIRQQVHHHYPWWLPLLAAICGRHQPLPPRPLPPGAQTDATDR